MQSPSLQLYNKIFELAEGYGIPAINYKEMTEEIPYPFLAVQQSNESIGNFTHDDLSGEVSVQIKLFSLSNDRGEHDMIANQLRLDLVRMNNLSDYTLNKPDIQTSTMEYREANRDLLQTNITAEFNSY